jgi:uncharacterized protein YycO
VKIAPHLQKPDIDRQLGNAKKGDILLFYRAQGINRIITMFSRSRYYHVGIYAGEHFVVESRPTGVQKRDLRKPGSGQWFRVIPMPSEQGEPALIWASAHIGDGYAVLSVLGLIIDRLSNRFEINLRQRDKFSCGELVVKAFAHAGVSLFPGREAEVVAPWDFVKLLPKKYRDNPRF